MSSEILRRFLENGFQLHPEALKLICSQESPERIAERVIASLDSSVLVVQPEHVFPFIRERREDGLKILESFTSSSSNASVENFHRYFLSRYEKLRRIIEQRGIRGRDISTIGRVSKGSEVTLIGMINDIRETSSGNILIELEDQSGAVTAVITKESECFERAKLLVRDEVVALRGIKQSDLLIVRELIEPDVRVQRLRNVQKVSSGILFLSDIHVGSNTFLKEEWEKLISWINGENGNESQRALAEKIEYIIVAGDLVDGVGIYPNQDKELEILDVYHQYEAAAELFERIPGRIKSHREITMQSGRPNPSPLFQMKFRSSSRKKRFLSATPR
ncbi:MAG: hypothetical protein H5T46_04480 [Archaeoglobi archaeon]|nr:hypothetical protein [Candidatus Mnemosynella sp.]